MRPERLFEILAVAERLKCNTRHSWTSTAAAKAWRSTAGGWRSWRCWWPTSSPTWTAAAWCACVWCTTWAKPSRETFPPSRNGGKTKRTRRRCSARWVETLPEPLRAEWRSLYAEMEALATPEARLYKALDKLEAVIQHNEADIATWLPLEYDLNIAYGADEVAWNGYLRRLKEAANEISRQKIAEARRQAPDDAGK